MLNAGHLKSLRLGAVLFTVLFSACTPSPQQIQPSTPAGKVNQNTQSGDPLKGMRRTVRSFRALAAHAEEPPILPLQTTAQTPVNPTFELQMKTGTAPAGGIRIPDQGPFELHLEAGSSFAVLDADSSDDGIARIQVPAQVLDFYLQVQAAPLPPLCPTGSNNGPMFNQLDQLDQLVLAKIDSLIAQGKQACVAKPPSGQPRQNLNCNSTNSGLQCSGPVNKTISRAQCPEIAVYAGGMNLNHDLSTSKLFVAVSNNLTLNHAGKGVYASRGNLNSNLNGNRKLEGVFVAGGSSNLNLSGTPEFKGLYHLANNASLSMNMNGNARFEGAMCSTGTLNFNRNGNTQVIYQPEALSPWLADLPGLPELLCPARSNFYTQTQPLSCPEQTGPVTVALNDSLYGVEQALRSDQGWTHLPRRPLPVPTDWGSADGDKYVLRFNNQGADSLSLKAFAQSAAAQVPASVKVIPAVDCIQANPDGSHTAYLSYSNLMAGPVSLPVGDSNHLQPSSLPQNQPTTFAQGQSAVYPNSAYAVTFGSPELSWVLGARVVTVQATDPALQCPEPEQNSPELLIEDVTLTETGESIFGPEAPAAMVPDFAGKAIGLTLTGTFKDIAGQPLSLNDFLFTLAPPLIQQSFIGTEPPARVLLNESVLLEVQAVNETEIKAVLQSERNVDLYLKGLHRISVEQGDWYTDALIKIGDPIPPAESLQPHINSVEVMRAPNGQPLHLRLSGRNFNLFPKFYYCTIDGEFGFGFQTEVLADGSAETVVHIPEPATFDQQSEHVVIMATPFGVAFKEFGL